MAEPPQLPKTDDTINPPSRRWLWVLLAFLLLITLFPPQQSWLGLGKPIPIAYSDLKAFIARGEVLSCEIGTVAITGEIKRNPSITAPPAPEVAETTELPFRFHALRIEDPKLVDQLEAAGIPFRGKRESTWVATFLMPMLWFLPLIFLWIFISRRAGAAGQSIMGIGKSGSRYRVDKNTGVTFADVAGCDESKAELEEVVDFLQRPERYHTIGAKIPKGVLLVGPPGTGKTLLARAIAGEAQVPFFSLSGSDFVELFVGVGASRVRSLFDQAKQQAPCIVFIDELDAIGRQRGVHMGSANDEREQTLNQLLVEMDGFEPNNGVILLSATNRPDVLDPALLRPGRFDRQVVLDAPDLDGREAILKVHARGKRLGQDVELRPVAQGTPGFSGADLANALNEAALLAARAGRKVIHQNDIEEAIERVVAGPERKSRRMLDDEKRRVAIHESGHAVVAAYSKHADPVHKISIIPRGQAALGYTLQLPKQDQYLSTKESMLEKLQGILGGRAAEEILLDSLSSGAENDLQRATAIARQMICMFGMGKSVGMMHCAKRESSLLVPGSPMGLQMDCSEETARAIDEEVIALIQSSYEEATALLRNHRHELEYLSSALLERETLDEETFLTLLQEAKKCTSPDSTRQAPEPVASEP
jgi:cell division protease FtsH